MSAEKVAMLSDLVHEKTSETEFDAFLLQLTKLDEFYCHRCNEEGKRLCLDRSLERHMPLASLPSDEVFDQEM